MSHISGSLVTIIMVNDNDIKERLVEKTIKSEKFMCQGYKKKNGEKNNDLHEQGLTSWIFNGKEGSTQ